MDWWNNWQPPLGAKQKAWDTRWHKRSRCNQPLQPSKRSLTKSAYALGVRSSHKNLRGYTWPIHRSFTLVWIRRVPAWGKKTFICKSCTPPLLLRPFVFRRTIFFLGIMLIEVSNLLRLFVFCLLIKLSIQRTFLSYVVIMSVLGSTGYTVSMMSAVVVSVSNSGRHFAIPSIACHVLLSSMIKSSACTVV